ncbi:MAG TPA: phosphotransferase [Anaerolineales bacterium]|nr:phosphotransferase [Anaerolineales bacterium]
MASSAIENLIGSLDNDLPRSALFQEKVPALNKAFDAGQMKTILQEALLGSAEGRYSIVKCVPGKALYLLDHTINMQFKLELLDSTNNETIPTLVNARLFKDATACKAFLEQVLMPTAARMEGRPEIKPFASPIAIIEHLNMTLSVYPIDGLIPTLVDATDTHKVARLFSETIPEAVSGAFSIQNVDQFLAHYGRYKRCVLRYTIDGVQTETQIPQQVTVYGKVDADGLGGATEEIISALRERLNEPELPYKFRVPRSLGFFPDLQLLLMEALPGKPFFKPLLKAWIENNNRKTAGEENLPHEEDATLEKAIRTCALIAVTLHGSNIQLGPRTTLEIQVDKLLEETDVLSHVLPDLGAQVRSWIDHTVEFSQAYPAMPTRFSHGDFTYTQLIFDGKEGGLVDFDTMCQAEPAQDLGHYLAYQRLNIIKDQDPNSPFPPEVIEHLCAVFLDTYIDSAKTWIPDEELLRGRVAIYELISLIRLTLHSWEKMKGSRLKQTMTLLEERIECQKQVSLSIKNKTS